MKKILFTALVGVGVFALMLILTGCDHARAAGFSDPPNGRSCTVQFRRDALGAAASLPVSPMTDGINGADVTVAGTLKHTSDEWVVLDRAGKELWIPKSVILLLHFR
jgi:hypothetical protein